MPTPPFAQMLCSLNGGAASTGGLTAPSAATVQLSGANTSGWRSALWQMTDYPTGFTAPAGWSTDPGGIIFYAGVTPPSFTLPANTVRWGKWMIKLTVNGGVDEFGVFNAAKMIDTATAVSVLSPKGQISIGAGETTQFGGALKGWVAQYQADQIALEALLGGASVPTLVSITPAQGPMSGSTAVALVGTNFLAGDTVTICGIAATSVVVVDATHITCTTGAKTGAIAIGDVVVTHAAGGSATLAAAFSYFARVDFTALTPGSLVAGAGAGSAFEIATGLRLTRASAAVVQTSDRTFVAGLANDTARIGQFTNTSLFRGLLLEESRTNEALQSRSNTVSPWASGTATITANYAAAPDGTTVAARIVKTGTQNSNYLLFSAASTGKYSYSFWKKATDGVSSFASSFGGGGSLTTVVDAVGATWSRFTFADPAAITAGNGCYHIPVWNDSGSYDELIDGHQAELGKFPTSLIVTTTVPVTRATEHFYQPVASNWLNAGRIRLAPVITPLGATADYSAAMPIFYVDANNYAEVSTSGNWKVVIAGTTVTFGTPITWNALDSLSFELEAGNGVSTLTTVINGATAVVQTGASLGALVAGGTMDLLCNSSAGTVFSNLGQQLEAYP